ncbi:MAG TPA: hypothetical protein PLK12_10185 [Prolixibacteraceae bacterium]|nr:hypothetical protein [Prolixibacteraceae bacterium]
MKNKLFVSISAMALAVFLFTGCAKLPQVEIDNANLAISEAQKAGADVYVPEAFTALQDSMNAAMESIEAQKSKLFKSYKSATTQLLAVTENAAVVKGQAEAKIAELKAAIQAALAEIAALNNENKELVTKAPKGKGGTTVLMAIKSEIANIDTALAEVSAIPETENLNNTLAKATALKEQAAGINTELKTVIEKYQSRR